VIARLLQPWRTAQTWRTLAHTALDLPIGIALFTLTIALLGATLGLAITLPLAIVPLGLLLLLARAAGTVERSRLSALHGVRLDDPIRSRPAATGSRWARFRAAATSKPRWKEIGYCLLRLPASMLVFGATMGSWGVAAALVLLPVALPAMPSEAANFGAFHVTAPHAYLLAVVGLLVGIAVAPWVTTLGGKIDVALGRWLLGPPVEVALAERVVKAETGRVAAVDSAEAERRRIERDLHDGAQQRLVALAVDLGAARERLETDPEGGKALVAEAHEEAKAALKEIRDLVRGIHPVILEDRGLDAALSSVVARLPIPVDLSVEVAVRPAPAIESAAYFVVSEALTNVARHSSATKAHVSILRSGDRLIVEVRDNGRGGADPASGTGLAGLSERVVGLGGTMDVLSPDGGPTTVLVELPCAS